MILPGPVRTTVKSPTNLTGEDVAGTFLLVVSRDAYATYDLPATGTLTIGRGETNVVRVDDPMASRAHACLHVGERTYIEDVGSVNGTRVKDRQLKPGERVEIAVGDTVQIGSSVLIVQRRSARPDLIRPETLRDEGIPAAPVLQATSRGSEAMLRVHALAEKAAAGTINVLITGETGVGKELLAETVHRKSPRHEGPYVCLNCAALSETLLESELFGHERGAFTGAVQAKPGLLETASGGTVFLDEVGELPLTTQAKLLRVIETRQVTRLGSVKPRRIDARFIAATNRNLEAEVSRGAFRQDLYFRLNGITLTIPPLRERVGEIRPLADTFVRQICRDLGRTAPLVPSSILGLLEAYGWPGNIRELKNMMERAVLLCTGPVLDKDNFPLDKLQPTSSPGLSTSSSDNKEISQTGAARTERERIVQALAACAGNQSRAAQLLGIPRRTFVSKLDAYQIPRPKKG